MTYWAKRVNALCNLSRNKMRKVTAATSGPSRRWFRLCITMEVEARNRIAEQYKMPILFRLQETYRGKVVEDGGKVFLYRFPADQKMEKISERRMTARVLKQDP